MNLRDLKSYQHLTSSPCTVKLGQFLQAFSLSPGLYSNSSCPVPLEFSFLNHKSGHAILQIKKLDGWFTTAQRRKRKHSPGFSQTVQFCVLYLLFQIPIAEQQITSKQLLKTTPFIALMLTASVGQEFREGSAKQYRLSSLRS